MITKFTKIFSLKTGIILLCSGFLFFGLSGKVEAAPAVVQAGQCNTGGFNCTITLTLTPGNMLFVGMVGSTGTLTISDNRSDSFVDANPSHNYNTMTGKTQYVGSVAGGSTTITCADSSNTNTIACVAVEISGTSASPLDQVAVNDTANTGSTGTASSGTTGTTAQADEIVIGMFGSNGNPAVFTAGSGYTIPTNGSQVSAGLGSALEYKVVSSTGTYTPSVAEDALRNTIGFVATFKGVITSDTTPPTPGNSGTITTASVTSSSLTLNWTKGTDDISTQGALKYRVYRSSSNNITTVANMYANGTALNASTTDIATLPVTSLSPSTTYYFNVIVQDEAGNTAAYTTKSQATAAADITLPTPGGSGTITATSVTNHTLTLDWTKATDDISAQSALQYRVYRSLSNNIDTVAHIFANGTAISASTTDIATLNVSGLSPSTTYYFNVVVADEAGNSSVYTTKSQATLDSGPFSPSDLPNLTLWLDPALGTYTNTGMTTPASTDGASVCGWTDQSASANNATGAACAVLKLAGNGINGHAALNFTSGNARLYTPSFLSSAYDHAVTIYVVAVPINGQAVKVAVANQGITNYVGGETDNATYATPWNFTANIPITGHAFLQQTQTSDQGVYITSEAISGSTALFRNNNILRYEPDTAVAGLSGTLAIGGQDSSTGFTWTGLIGDILVFNATHTRAQQLQVTDYLLAKYGKTQVSTLPNVALQGNSLTAGNGASAGNTDIGTYIATTLGKGYSFFSHGIAGRILTDMTTDATTEVDPSINSGISSNIIIGWEGTNALNASTPAQIITQYQTYFAARTSAGWNKRIVADVLPNCSGSGAYETNRLALNSLLSSAFNVPTAYTNVYAAAPGTTWADYLVKLTGDSTVGQPGQCSNVTYYADGTHMTAAGYALIAPYFSNAAILANDASVAPTITAFAIPSTASSLTVSISTFTATDNIGVTGYMATTTSTTPSASDSTWQGTAPTSYTFSSAGSKTLYAWVKDAAGNVSASANAPVTITLPSAQDIYVAQNSSGLADGTNCANAYAVSFFNTSGNWANPKQTGKIGPSDTVHLCGTFTGTAGATMLTTQNSGTSGNPITIKFETGADLTAPYWSGTNGAIYCNANNYITIDGGTNGKIENTANGTALTYQQTSRGIVGNACNNFTVKNVTASNFYIRTEGNTTDNTDVICIEDDGADNVIFQSNTVDHCRVGFTFGSTNTSTTHGPIEIKNNTLTFVEHGITIASSYTDAILDGISIHDNDFGGGAYLWDSGSANIWHHDPIHMFSQVSGASITNVQIYNNYFHGIWSRDAGYGGTHITAMVYLEQIGSGSQIFNNIFDSTDGTVLNYPANGYIDCKGSGSDSCKIYNNTFVSANHWGTSFECNSNSGHIVQNNIFAGPDPSYTSGCTISTLDHNVSYADGSVLPNYHLGVGSSAIGAGANLSSLNITALNSDKAGVVRPSGSTAWDDGAYQYVVSSDVTNPTSGNSGTITTASVTSSSLTLNWTKGTDDTSAQSALKYRVYKSSSNNISTVANMYANGTALNASTTDIATLPVTSLSPSTTYYFNVIVQDEAGNTAAYTTKSQATAAAPSTDTSITSFSFASPAVSGTVDNTAHTVAITVPFGTTITALTPTIVLATGATISPLSGTPQNFSSPIIYTVTAQDGTTNQTYTVTVTVASATSHTITASSGANGSISPSGSVSVNNGADQAFTITPNSGYHIDTVTTDSVAVSATSPYTFTNVTADHTISATFAADAVVVSGGGGGGGGGGNGPIYSSTRHNISNIISTTPATTTCTTSTSTISLTRNLSRGSEGNDVTALQRFLVSKNFLTSDNITGYFGIVTETAVKAFQKSFGIVSSGTPATTGYGNVGVTTRAKIISLGNTTVCTPTQTNTVIPVSASYNFVRNLSLNMTGEDVRNLQKFLNTNGFTISKTGTGSTGKESTLFGMMTYKALVKFQLFVGLPATGFFGPLTREYVNNH